MTDVKFIKEASTKVHPDDIAVGEAVFSCFGREAVFLCVGAAGGAKHFVRFEAGLEPSVEEMISGRLHERVPPGFRIELEF